MFARLSRLLLAGFIPALWLTQFPDAGAAEPAAAGSVSASRQTGPLGEAQRGTIDLARARSAARPRSFSDADEWAALRHALLHGERKADFEAFLGRLQPALGSNGIDTLASGGQGKDYAERAQASLGTKQKVDAAKELAQGLAFAALVSGEQKYVAAAKRHMLALAALDPAGATSVRTEDLSARHIAWTLALGLDWLHPHLSAGEKSRFLDAISVRMEDFAERLIRGPRPLERQPLDSHGNEVLGALAEIGVLLAGETAAADRWMREFIPLYARLLSPFGGADGGYANGTAYAAWDLHEYSLRHWDTLRRALGIDLSQKDWARNIGKFLVYFVPPGTPVGTFGDGAELAMPKTWALTAKAYAARVPTPLSRWYARQWFQEDRSALELLLSPLLTMEAASFPEGTPHSVALADVGAVAMHSDLRDRGRVSVYFRSSPLGAVSHAHADQNSFTLNARGRRLLIDSGYYDYFGSPHHFEWTKTTKAHNAITFDGGQGQDDSSRPWGDVSSKGKIVQFVTTADMDIAVGDASASYRGQTTGATRAIVFLKPRTLLVFDQTESATPRSWEWNVHAANKFGNAANGELLVEDQDVSVCLKFHADAAAVFHQSNVFTRSPVRTKAEIRPDQWHGYFKTENRVKKFKTVAVLSIDCKPVRHTVEFSSTGIRVRLDDRLLSFDGERVRSQGR